MIPWESPLEHDALVVFEFDREIVSVRDHQEEIEIDSPSGAFKAYPDFAVLLESGQEDIIEVKADSALADPDMRRKLADIAIHFSLRGIRYRVLSESEIRKQPRLEVLEQLVPHRRTFAVTALRQHAAFLKAEFQQSPMLLGDLAKKLRGNNTAERLIANGLVLADLNKKLTSDTVVTLATDRNVC